MTEIEDALKRAIRIGYDAAENGENLEETLENIKVEQEAQEV